MSAADADARAFGMEELPTPANQSVADAVPSQPSLAFDSASAVAGGAITSEGSNSSPVPAAEQVSDAKYTGASFSQTPVPSSATPSNPAAPDRHPKPPTPPPPSLGVALPDAAAPAAPAPLIPLWPALMSVFLDSVGISLVIPVFPYIVVEYFNQSVTQLGVLMSVAGFSAGVGTIVCASLSDRVGRRNMILLSIIGDCAGFLASGLSVNFAMFFAARCIAGFFSSSRPIVASLITDATQDIATRTKYLGISGACTGMGFTFGPPISVSINAIFKAVGIAKFDAFRYTFLFAACVSFLSFLLACSKLQEVPKSAQHTADSAAAAASSLESKGFVHRWRLRLAVLKAMGPLLWTFLFLVLVQFFTAYSFSVMQSTYGVFIAVNFSWGTTELGVILCSAGLVIGGVQGGAIKKISEKIGLCRLLQLGIFLLAVGLLYALPRHSNAELLPHFVLFYMLVAGFSIAGTAPPLPTLINCNISTGTAVTSLVSTISKDNVGALIGAAQGMGEVAGTLSPIVSASLFAINSGSDSPHVNFGAHIGQGSLPNVVTAALLLLLLLVTPVPLRVIQARLDQAGAKNAPVNAPAAALADPPAGANAAMPPSDPATQV
jgi:MFS family permease